MHIQNTIKQQVYNILKDRISNGIYKPGEWLQEYDLANDLSVSRSPVREALRHLASDGLVISVPNKGVFVKEFSPKDIEDIYDLRVMLESYSIQKSHENLTEEKKKAFLKCISGLKHLHYVKNLQSYIELDTKLHNLIISLSGNGLVEATYDKLHSMCKQFRIYSLTGQQRFDESVEEHRNIVHSMLTGNIIEAERINKIHLELAKEKILEYLAGLGNSSSD